MQICKFISIFIRFLSFVRSVLYGNNREQQLSIRQMKEGLLNPDQWCDNRLVVQPAGKIYIQMRKVMEGRERESNLFN